MKLLRFALAAAALVALLALAAPAMAATTTTYHATFVEIGSGGPAAGVSCGSATISQLGHVANQCIVFDACGPNCAVRTIAFDDGSTLVIQESIVGVISPGGSSAAGANAPRFPGDHANDRRRHREVRRRDRQWHWNRQYCRGLGHHHLGDDHAAVRRSYDGGVPWRPLSFRGEATQESCAPVEVLNEATRFVVRANDHRRPRRAPLGSRALGPPLARLRQGAGPAGLAPALHSEEKRLHSESSADRVTALELRRPVGRGGKQWRSCLFIRGQA